MENALQLAFNFESSEVRTITDETGEIWFVGKDVAVALGHSNPERAIRKFVDEEDQGVTELVTPGGIQKNHNYKRAGYVWIGFIQSNRTRKEIHAMGHLRCSSFNP